MDSNLINYNLQPNFARGTNSVDLADYYNKVGSGTPTG